ncbi:MAG: VWA domain-containing protein [Acidobacteriota bacterium]|nr:VWA domain-containing protein [Acidobacteriota bacterium]
MRAFPKLFCSILVLGLTAVAQTAPPAPSPAPPPKPSPQTESPQSSGLTLTTGTQLVVVDVSVEDRDGHAIHGLQRSDFQVLENKKPETIKTFDEHSAANLAQSKTPPPPALKLPPGTFTDYTPVPADSTLNVLLLDALNTPMKDQAYVRYQLQQYVKHSNPGTRIAIFGLTTRLIILQGFTSDPETLKAAVEHRLIPRASVLLDDPTGANTDPVSLADSLSELGASASAVAGLQQFEAQNASFQTQLRTQYTLDAFNALARYLSAFPGRKNLIWFSGSFPLSIFADPTLDDPFAVQANASEELRQTTNLLDRARVAVYPIDARGLQTTPVFDASRSGRGFSRNPGKLTKEISDFNATNAQEHFTMQQIAEDTGGQAFYNTNGLAEAVVKSIEAGSNFYTLTYTPSNREPKGEYRNIRVELNSDAAARGLKLSYRHGYFAEDPKARTRSTALQPSAPATPAATPATERLASARRALQRGAPAPSEILFKVRVLPDSNTTEEKVAPHNQPNPDANLKGPFRRYDVSFGALGSGLALPLSTDGRRHGGIQFLAYVYDAEGKLLNIEANTMTLNLEPATYTALMKSGLQFSMQVSAPARGESFLRLAVLDTTSGHIGVFELPTTTVSHLPPISPAPTAPAPASPASPAAQK